MAAQKSSLIRFLLGALLVSHVLSFFSFTKPVITEVETAIDGVRGVPKYHQKNYEGETLTCDENQKTYSSNEINDGYCDCLDKSDEPGTSACLGNIFHCVNKGFRIMQIPSSRVDDGVCDCCDGSDEGNLVRCGNHCAAAAVDEKATMERITSAYRIGSVIRAADVERVEKTKLNLLLAVEPLRISYKNQKRIVEDLKEVRDIKDNIYDESNTRANNQVMITAGDLLGLSDISEHHLAKFLSSLFTTLAMNEEDVRGVAREAGMEPFESLHHNTDRDNEREEADEENYSEEGDDNEISPVIAEDNIKDKESAPVIPNIPFHCTLLNHVEDIRLQALCNHKPSGDESSLSIEEATATSIAAANAKRFLVQLMKSRDVYTTIQLLVGFRQMTGSFDGYSDFIKTQNELMNPESCPAAWAVLEEVNDLCSLAEKLKKLFDFTRSLPEKDQQPQINLAAGEEDLKESEKQLSKVETELQEMDKYAEFPEYLALKNNCLDGHDGKFTYSVCILDKLTQKDGEDTTTEVTLGTFSSIENDTKTGGITMHFTEGTNCWAFGPRTADVFISCGPEQKMISSSEPTTCYYTFEVQSPSGCTEQFAQINGIGYDQENI